MVKASVIHVDVVEGIVQLLLIFVVLHFLLILEIIFDLRQHFRFLCLDVLFLTLYFFLDLCNLFLFKRLSLLLDLLNLFLHLRSCLLVLLLVFVRQLNFSYFFKFDLSHIFINLLQPGLIILLKLILLLLDGGPDLLNPLLELFLKFLQFVLVEEHGRGLGLDVKVNRNIVALQIEWIVRFQYNGLCARFWSSEQIALIVLYAVVARVL